MTLKRLKSLALASTALAGAFFVAFGVGTALSYAAGVLHVMLWFMIGWAS